MSILLFGISHNTTPVEVRQKFSFDDEQKLTLLQNLTMEEEIEEAVILSTCNRMEIYAVSGEETDPGRVFTLIRRHALKAADAEYIPDINDYIFLYTNHSAVNHLFHVTAGFDSMILGEDQILGQVKQAHDFSRSAAKSGPVLNLLFQYAVTAAKKIKTDTVISRSPESYGTLALKAAEEKLGTLKGKKILVIGASGKMGGIVFKNAVALKNTEVYATKRSHNIEAEPSAHSPYRIIPYEERYHILDEIDVIISATSSPHYTISKNHILGECSVSKPRVYVDLAVPMDIDPEVRELPETWYFNQEDLRKLSQENNLKKQAELPAAETIMDDYIAEFGRHILFKQYLHEMKLSKKLLEDDAEKSGWDKAMNHFFYRMRDAGDEEEIRGFFAMLEKMNREWNKRT
jgi:glutamyl-tRNA reductase